MQSPDDARTDRHAILLGIGLDGDDHKRVTKSRNFVLFGGSERTHEAMQEHAIKIGEELRRRGKSLADVRSPDEFRDIADHAGR
jgi:hypothetical protein